MAIIKSNILLMQISGMLGKQVVFRNCGDKIVMANRPFRKKKHAVGGQAIGTSNFQDAVAKAKVLLRDPVIKAEYQAKAKKGQNAYNVMMSEFMLEMNKKNQASK
jgi:hypothetical protein